MAKEVRKTIGIFVNGKEVENNLKSIKAAIAKVSNELNKMTVGTDEYNAHAAKLSQLKKIYDDYKEELKDVREELDAGSKAEDNFIIKAGARASIISTGAKALQKFVSSTQEYVEAYATIDDAMTNVSKYTGLTREEVEQLNEEFKKIDTRTPTEKLNALAADAGRLGITSKKAVKDFVEAADIINIALGEDLGDDAVKNIGKMAQMFGESETMGLRGAMIATASAVNSLGQSSSASEPYIVEFTSRLAGVANTAGITQANIMGIASAMDQNMGQVERSATAVQKVMMDMMSKTDKYAELVGMTSNEFKNLVDSDMNAAFLSVLDALNRISSQGGSALAETLSDLKLKGSGVQETLMSLANNTDKLREAQLLATQAYSDGNSVLKEAEAVNSNAAAQLEIAKKRMQDAKAEIGQSLIPVITKITEMSAGAMQIAIQIGKWMVQNKSAVFAYAAAMTVLYAIRQKEFILAKKEAVQLAVEKAGVATATTFTNLFALAKARLTKNTLAAATAQKALKAAFASTPWGAIITLVTSLAVTMFTMKKNTDAAADAQRDLSSTIEQNYNEEAFEIEKLRKLIDDENVSREEKLKAINRLKEIIPEYTAELSKEGLVTNQNTQAIDNYLSRLHDKIELEATEAKLKDLYNDKADKRAEYEQKRDNFLNSSLWFGYRKRRKEYEEAAKAYEEAAKAYDNMEDSYDEMMKRQMASGNSVVTNNTNGNVTVVDTNSGGSSSKTDPIADFNKKLEDFRSKQQLASLDGWEKTKQGILNSYQEMIDEANKLNRTQTAKDLETERDDAIKAAGEKYVKNASDAFDKVMKEADEMLKSTSNSGEENKLLNAVAGTQKQWDEKIRLVRENYNAIKQILDDDLKADDPNKLTAEQRTVFENGLQEAARAELELTTEKMQAITNVVKANVSDEKQFITEKETELRRSRMNDYDRQIEEIETLYNAKIEAKRKEIESLKALRNTDGIDNEELQKKIEDLEALIDKLEGLKSSEKGNVKKTPSSDNVWDKLLSIDWSKFKDNWRDNLQTMTAALQEFASTAFDIFNSINQIQSNRENAAFDEWCDIQDEKADALQRQLDDGIISQKYYDAQMDKMQEEKEAKEKKIQHDQFERDKKANIIQATINGALAIVTAFAQLGPIAGAIAAVLTAATTAAQIAVIASQANPYAKGGFIRKEQIALMGEEGEEWVASHKLLTDKKTAPVINALESYQRGDQQALDALSPVSEPSWENLSQSSKMISRTFATQSQNVTNVYNTNNSNNTTTTNNNGDNSELLKEMRQMNAYLKDPKNRQAYITRKMQLEFDKQEQEIKEMSRL